MAGTAFPISKKHDIVNYVENPNPQGQYISCLSISFCPRSVLMGAPTAESEREEIEQRWERWWGARFQNGDIHRLFAVSSHFLRHIALTGGDAEDARLAA
jgi:hypothetical protein